METTAIADWLGADFSRLHPQLQTLHRFGGVLHGTVEVRTGRGIAGLLGRRLARKLGVPVDQPRREFRVEVEHDTGAMLWKRHFAGHGNMVSRFIAHGTVATGYLLEQTGALKLKLTVDVVDGGWYWRTLAVAFGPLPLPLALLPRTRAFKRIEDDRYRFCVELSLPFFGTILSYGGLLACSINNIAIGDSSESA